MLRRKINQENRKYQWLCACSFGVSREDHDEKVTLEQDLKEVREAIR